MNLVVLPVAIRGANSRFVDLTIKACEAARHAAGRAADMIASGNIQHLSAIYGCESLLDEIDREMDEAVVFAISESSVTEARASGLPQVSDRSGANRRPHLQP